jgi:L-alanine-DL-glutamate epimerase-like enolase superfamily enzyme
MPIAAGEWLSTRHEFRELLDRGRLVVPHCWKTGISIAAAAHLAAVTPHCPYFEFLPAELAESALRRELVAEELRLVDGRLPLPQRPGLGIELDRDALERFEAAARTLEAD